MLHLVKLARRNNDNLITSEVVIRLQNYLLHIRQLGYTVDWKLWKLQNKCFTFYI